MREAYKRLENGEAQTEVAKDLGISVSQLRYGLGKAGLGLPPRRKTKVGYVCSHCGKHGERYKSQMRLNIKVYCSKECMRTDRKVG